MGVDRPCQKRNIEACNPIPLCLITLTRTASGQTTNRLGKETATWQVPKSKLFDTQRWVGQLCTWMHLYNRSEPELASWNAHWNRGDLAGTGHDINVQNNQRELDGTCICICCRYRIPICGSYIAGLPIWRPETATSPQRTTVGGGAYWPRETVSINFHLRFSQRSVSNSN